jgi:adenylate cyclase
VSTTARDWLIAGAPGAVTSPEVLAGTCERLIRDGVPVARAEAYVRKLHPLVAGRAFEWTPVNGCRAIESKHEADLGAASSPIRRVFETARVHRVRVRSSRDSTPYLDEMLALQMTDVLAMPFLFTSGEVHAVAFATDREGGFDDDQVAVVQGVLEPLTRMAEILALRRTATNVLTAYVGRDAGARVLAGKIRRGDVEMIEAVIWFSDMRGFSAMSNQTGAREVIALLNELFDCQVPAIEEHGGEVLKFIGDGLLAIFAPRAGGEDDLCACAGRALAASRDALARLAARNEGAAAAGAAAAVRLGIALHVGELAYGNIGGAARLDFTCIGRAVNLAARIESLTGALGYDVLASEDFARLCGDGVLQRIGEHPVKGFAYAVPVFAPRAE